MVRKFLTALILVTISVLNVGGTPLSQSEDSLNVVLSHSVNKPDSIRVMCDLFDLAQSRSYMRADSIAREIIGLARATGNTDVMVEMMRNRLNFNLSCPDTLDIIYNRACRLPASVSVSELKALLSMAYNSYYARYSDNENRKSRLKEYFDGMASDSLDVFERIVVLHAICANVSQLSRGDLLVDYERRLGKLIESLPAQCRSLRSMYYVQASLDMATAGEPAGAVEANVRMLQVIDSLQVYYEDRGRRFRNFDANRYVCYSRLLACWPILTDEQVNEYYDRAMDIARRDTRARVTYNLAPVPDIHRAMWGKNYAVALPLIRKAMDSNIRPISRNQLLQYGITASRAVGDKAMLLQCLDEYSAALEKRLSDNAEEKYQELQVVYDLYDKERANVQLRLEKVADENRFKERMILLSVASIVLLLLLGVILAVQYRRYLVLFRSAKLSNDRLLTQTASLESSRSELRKARDEFRRSSDFKANFIRNLYCELEVPMDQLVTYSRLVADSAEPSARPYYEDYVHKIEMNCGRITSIFNDLMHVYKIESNQIRLESHTVNLSEEIDTVVNALTPLAVSRGDEIETIYPECDVIVSTDPRRFQQVMHNIIRNAISRTDNGTVTLRLDCVDSKAVVTVTDHGKALDVDILSASAEARDTAGNNGLWFTVSRMIARILDGELYVDRTVSGTTAFILKLPLSPAIQD